MNKIELGKFYTIKSPFKGEAWDFFSNNFLNKEEIILEPFAGANNIPNMLCDYKWQSYDILPENQNIIQRDTLKDFPSSFKNCITNPPYLDIRTARKKKIKYESDYSDLYLDALSKMLDNCENIVAIIPSTFINKKIFKERLLFWDKIDDKIFSDTDCAVGVAYFIKENVPNTRLFLNGKEIDKNSDCYDNKTIFNTRNANLSACLIDKPAGNSIKISTLKDFDWNKYCVHSSRYYVAFKDLRINENDIEEFNIFLNKWREDTQDYWLSPFKSQFKNNSKFRKRLSFNQLSGLIENYVKERDKNDENIYQS